MRWKTMLALLCAFLTLAQGCLAFSDTAAALDQADALTLTVGGTSMSFSSLGATLANPMTITYDANGIQSIRVGSTSAMSKRSGTSADDLIGICGKINEISFTANINVTAVFRFRGAWA